MPPYLSVVIPAYNEQQRLERPLREALAYLRGRGRTFELIVVDDGSKDATAEVVNRVAAEAPQVRLIRLPENCGKGYAVRTGIVNAEGDRVLFADADGATPWAELEKLEAALSSGAALAVGSRAIARAGVDVQARFYRRIMGRIFHALVRRIAVHGFQDTQCGFKLFSAAAAHDLFSHLRMRGFSFDVEVLLMAQRRGYRVDEIPVNWVHQPGSRVNVVLDSLRMARDLFIIRGNALRGEYERPRIAPLRQRPTPVAPASAVGGPNGGRGS